MAKDIFVLIQYNKSTNKFDIKFFPDALEAKEFQANLIQAAPGEDLVFNSFIVNEFKKKVSQPNMFFYTKPNIQIHKTPKFGLLYNKAAFTHPLFAPPGWHVPTPNDLYNLWESFSYWTDLEPFGFAKAGYIQFEHINFNINSYIASCPSEGNSVFVMAVIYNESTAYYSDNFSAPTGLSVYLVKDNLIDEPLMDIDGNIYQTELIDNLIISKQPFACTKLNDSTPLSFISDFNEWYSASNPSYIYPNSDISNVFI